MIKVKTRVLLAEDEIDAREILQFYLQTIFDEVFVAQNGLEAYNICREKFKKNIFFDIIITDIKMPKKDGMTLIEEISEILPEQKYIVVSAYKDEEYLFKSISFNVIGYFVKPLAIDNIMDMLKKLKEDILLTKQKKPTLIKLNKTYSYNTNIKQLYKNGKQVRLSKKELDLVQILIHNLNNIVSKDNIKTYIWNDTNTSDTSIRAIVKRVKDKILDDDFIISRKGYGYTIEAN
jgi:DNA-binding response OmpR family regulator